MIDGAKDGLEGRAPPSCLRFMGWVGSCSHILSYTSHSLLYFYFMTLQHFKRPLQHYPNYRHHNDELSDDATIANNHPTYV
jgi:hypothetical protein